MKRLMYSNRLALLLLLLCTALTAEARADVKIKTRQTSAGHTSEGTTYIKGKRQRTESGSGEMITIQECDLRRDIQIMPQAKAYVVRSYDAASAIAPTSSTPSTSMPQGPATKGGLVTSTVTSRDTGERKQMFGYTARHIITTMETTSSPDACSPMNSKMETDGWYIDAAFALDCDTARASAYMNRPQAATGCRDRFQTKQIGTAKRGFAVWEKMTMFGEDGRASFSTINEVIELSQATLDAALFEAPAGYHEVKDFSEAFSAVAGMSSSDDESMAASIGASDNNIARLPQSASAKRAGVIRLGLVAVTTGSVGDNISAADLSAVVAGALAARLSGSNVETVRIEAMMPQQIEAEAKQKECDFVVYANASHKKGGGGGFGGMLGKVTSVVATASVGEMGGDGQTSSGNATTATVSARVKAKDELTLDIRVQKSGGASSPVAQQFKAKAKSAGEDIITPVVEQAAQVVLVAAAVK